MPVTSGFALHYNTYARHVLLCPSLQTHMPVTSRFALHYNTHDRQVLPWPFITTVTSCFALHYNTHGRVSLCPSLQPSRLALPFITTHMTVRSWLGPSLQPSRLALPFITTHTAVTSRFALHYNRHVLLCLSLQHTYRHVSLCPSLQHTYRHVSLCPSLQPSRLALPFITACNCFSQRHVDLLMKDTTLRLFECFFVGKQQQNEIILITIMKTFSAHLHINCTHSFLFLF